MARRGGIQTLLALHGALHDGVMRLERIDIVRVGAKYFALDALTQAIVGHLVDDAIGVFFLDGNPAHDLVQGHQVGGQRSMQFTGRDHGLPNRGRHLFEFCHHGRVVEDTAGDLTMSASQTQHQMQGGFLLNIVIAQCTTILELFASKNQALLIGRNAFLVLNLGLDIVNRIGRFHIQRDGLARERLDENLGKFGT
jgi:hypothetical protein